jgi:hypothetical protein
MMAYGVQTLILASVSTIEDISFMRPYFLSPGVPLVLPSLNVAQLDTMFTIITIRSNVIHIWDILILAPAQDPVMQDATSKNKLHLSWERVEWFLIKDFEPIFQCSQSSLNGHPEARVPKVEELLCILWYVP